MSTHIDTTGLFEQHDAACKRLVQIIEQAARLLSLAGMGDDISHGLTLICSADHALYEVRRMVDPLVEEADDDAPSERDLSGLSQEELWGRGSSQEADQ